ncbi:MAG: FeoB-associated Cys-rich membrane protein, partial [Nitrososphaeraceae archaeon]
MKKGSGSRESDIDMLDSTDSPIMPTRYAHGSSKLIRSIEKTFYPIIGLIAALFLFAILDITDVISKYNILPDRTYDIIITFVAAILLAVVVYLLYSLIKSRKKLHHWADIFERNSIKAGLTISMSTTSKEHVLGALSETIEGIGEPLRDYLSSSPNSYKNLIDVQIDKDTVFDILIDKDHLINRTPSNQVSSITLSSKTTSTSIPDNEQTSKEISDLKESTRRYGAITARVTSGRINEETVKSFQAALQKYISSSRNKVALALIIGEGIDEEADNLSKLRIKGIDYFI